MYVCVDICLFLAEFCIKKSGTQITIYKGRPQTIKDKISSNLSSTIL